MIVSDTVKSRYPDDERIPVPPESWRFARIEGGFGLDNQGVEQALIPSDTHIHIRGGFEPGWIYELVYTAQDPVLLGLGPAAVRDLISRWVASLGLRPETAATAEEGGAIGCRQHRGAHDL